MQCGHVNGHRLSGVVNTWSVFAIMTQCLSHPDISISSFLSFLIFTLCSAVRGSHPVLVCSACGALDVISYNQTASLVLGLAAQD